MRSEPHITQHNEMLYIKEYDSSLSRCVCYRYRIQFTEYKSRILNQRTKLIQKESQHAYVYVFTVYMFYLYRVFNECSGKKLRFSMLDEKQMLDAFNLRILYL